MASEEHRRPHSVYVSSCLPVALWLWPRSHARAMDAQLEPLTTVLSPRGQSKLEREPKEPLHPRLTLDKLIAKRLLTNLCSLHNLTNRHVRHTNNRIAPAKRRSDSPTSSRHCKGSASERITMRGKKHTAPWGRTMHTSLHLLKLRANKHIKFRFN